MKSEGESKMRQWLADGMIGLLCSLAVAVVAPRAPAAALGAGDILVADSSGVLRIDSVTGTSSQLDLLVGWGIAVDSNHDVFVTDAGDSVHLIPAVGTPAVFVQDQLLDQSLGIAIEGDGNLLVVTSESRLYRIHRTSKSLQLLAEGGQIVEPTGVAVEPDGGILVIDPWRIVRVHPLTGVQSVLSGVAQAGVANRTRAGGDDIVSTESGAIYITDAADGIYEIDPDNGAQTQRKDINTSTHLWDPSWIAVETNGDFVLSDVNAGTWGSAIVRVSSGSGNEQILSDYPEVEGCKGIAVVPVPEPGVYLLQAASLCGVGLLSLSGRRRGATRRRLPVEARAS